ncbi:hypothetical protein PLICRDRAFT_696608 [Plicaturopsis crispa FD-325 SS-3]|nr:hypothetical protein PLICRDRAFT_696608 [Plicaturopsis crispa FD-325 SS-3]
MDNVPANERTPIDKGKGRAISPEPTERTPLIASQSFSPHEEPSTPTSTARRHSLWRKLLFVFLASLALCVVAFVVVALIAYSYSSRVSEISPSDLLDKGLVVRGPDRLDVLNITEDGGIWLNVGGKIGIDAGSVLEVNSDGDNDGLWQDFWKAIGRWGVRQLETVSVNLSTVQVSPDYDKSSVLARIHTPEIELPLTTDPPPDLSWLTAVSIPVFIQPTKNVSSLMQFARHTWRAGALNVHAHVGDLAVHGGSLDDSSWRRNFNVQRSDVWASIRMKIPSLPGLPTPGRNTPFPAVKDLVTLKSLSISSDTKSDRLLLDAVATVIDPAPLNLNFTAPTLPFVVSLPNYDPALLPVPVASVSTQPFSLTHPNITLSISGIVLPLPASAAEVLSTFLTRYLSAEANAIIITSPLFPGVTVDTDFPGPNPRPHILRNVTIHGMHIKPNGAGTTFLASGTVYARAVLPKGMNIGLDVNRVLPDVLVFDGEVPSEQGGGDEGEDGGVPVPPLPDPLPERAFARIRPDDWLPSLSAPGEPDEDEGAVFTVTAEIVDVPLEVLPGRQREFSGFVSKVIFGTQGALAGIQGSAAVSVNVHGLPIKNGSGNAGEMELTGLPVQGSVRIGKKSMPEPDLDKLRHMADRLSLPWHWNLD